MSNKRIRIAEGVYKRTDTKGVLTYYITYTDNSKRVRWERVTFIKWEWWINLSKIAVVNASSLFNTPFHFVKDKFDVIIIEPSSYFLLTIWKNRLAWISLNFTYPNSSITSNFETPITLLK